MKYLFWRFFLSFYSWEADTNGGGLAVRARCIFAVSVQSPV